MVFIVTLLTIITKPYFAHILFILHALHTIYSNMVAIVTVFESRAQETPGHPSAVDGLRPGMIKMCSVQYDSA